MGLETALVSRCHLKLKTSYFGKEEVRFLILAKGAMNENQDKKNSIIQPD